MDDIASAFEEVLMDDDEDDEMRKSSALVGWLHAIFIFLAVRWLINRCRPKREPMPAAHEEVTATLDQLAPKKSLMTSYALWGVAGLFGVHHFYLGRFVHGLLACWSMNVCGVGMLLDAFLMPVYVRRINGGCSDLAPRDGSRRIFLCKLPTMFFIFWGILLGTIVYGPTILHRTGVVDIDRLAAQTEANPYDTLGVPWSATMSEVKAAYRKESLRWHPDRNVGCGKECENKMSEITKAFELIKKKKAPMPADRTWESWLKDLGSDWMLVLETLNKDDDDQAGKSSGGGAQGRKAGSRKNSR